MLSSNSALAATSPVASQDGSTYAQAPATQPDGGTSDSSAQSVGSSEEWAQEAVAVWEKAWDELSDSEKTEENATALSKGVYKKIQEHAQKLHDEAQKTQGDTAGLDQVLEENLTAVEEALQKTQAAHTADQTAQSGTGSTEAGATGCAGSSAAPKAGNSGAGEPG
ncbi:small-conductance mechanosensitive channel [Streptomyces sp. V4I8]